MYIYIYIYVYFFYIYIYYFFHIYIYMYLYICYILYIKAPVILVIRTGHPNRHLNCSQLLPESPSQLNSVRALQALA